MVFVKVRETYDLHTVKNKMTVIGIHTPKPDIIKYNYPGLLMQCKMYRPVSADVRIACASMMPLDPLGVGTTEGDVAPEDVFNPILYKAMSNKGMSQLEARINAMSSLANTDHSGNTADFDWDDFTGAADDFNIYYGLLSNTHEWKHSNPQSGLEMNKLRPLVYELVYNIGDVQDGSPVLSPANYPDVADGSPLTPNCVLGKAKEFPFLNCTAYSQQDTKLTGATQPGFPIDAYNSETQVPYLNVYCGCIIIPPSRLHELYYRMVVEWTIEFSQIRPLGEIANLTGLGIVGTHTYIRNYNYTETKKAVTGSDETMLNSDACMVSANVDVNKVM